MSVANRVFNSLFTVNARSFLPAKRLEVET